MYNTHAGLFPRTGSCAPDVSWAPYIGNLSAKNLHQHGEDVTEGLHDGFEGRGVPRAATHLEFEVSYVGRCDSMK